MGFYLRKSVKAGPFRFNLSKSGVGVSVGVPGFRVGKGPRGNYVHAGRGGVYYRATLGGSTRRRGASSPAPRVYVEQPASFFPSDGIVMEDATGASAEALTPSGPGDLVEQLNAASRRPRLWLWAAAFFLIALIAKPIVGGPLLLLGVPVTVWLFLRDRARRAVVVFYDVNDAVATWFEDLVAAFEELAACAGIWRVNAAGQVRTTYQYKVNSGASKIVNRTSARLSFDPPTTLKTNIKVPTIAVGRDSIAFLPDRILVRSGRKYSDARYSDVEAAAYPQRFIETERPPRDSKQVDTTWRFVNKGGGPDRRFNNNVQLPVLLYGRLELSSRNGLFWVLDASRPEPTATVADRVTSSPVELQHVEQPVDQTSEPRALPAPPEPAS